MAGGVISHYELRSKLGQGGMGVVYRAVDTRLGRVVALKMIPREALGRDDLRRRMLREARAAAMLNHPNVCAVYDVDDALGFLVMECIEGSPLSDVLARGPLEPSKVIDIARQIAEGLSAAHQHGITHRDVKPSNILITHSGQVKITDFGLAKCSEESRLTLTGQIVGTPAYMAPEQILGNATDERADIWSFGVVLHELLTGTLPFRGGNVTALLYSIVHDEPLPIPLSAGPQRTALQPVLNRCLAKEPEQRYQRMRDIARDLGAATADGPAIPSSQAMRGENVLTVTVNRTAPALPSLAVLDFENRSADDTLDWLSVAVAETLSSDLRKVASLRVVERQQVAKAVRPQSIPAEAGADLGVRWVVCGSVEGTVSELRVSADLIECLSGQTHRIQERGPLDQILSLLTSVALRITENLGVQPTVAEKKRIQQPETRALDAYRLYARGRRLFYTFDIARMEEARDVFESAVKLDPHYGLSWAGLGTIYTFRYIKSTDPRDLQAGIGYLRQAISVDPELADAHTALAYAYLRMRSFDEGIRAGETAVELEPSSTAAHYFLGANYVGAATEAKRLEMFPLAEKHFAESVRIEPNYQPGLMMHGWILMLRGEHQEALTDLSRAAEVERTGRFDVMQMVGAQTLLGLVQYRMGNSADAEQTLRHSLQYLEGKRHLYRDLFISLAHCGLADIRLDDRLQDEAIEEFQLAKAAVERNPTGLGIGYSAVRVLTGLARAFQKLGMGRDARDHLQKAVELYRSKAGYDFHFIWEGCDAQASYDLARSHAVLDQRGAAAEWLAEAVASGWCDKAFLLRDESMKGLLQSGLLDPNLISG